MVPAVCEALRPAQEIQGVSDLWGRKTEFHQAIAYMCVCIFAEWKEEQSVGSCGTGLGLLSI